MSGVHHSLSAGSLPEAADGLLASLQRAQAELEQIANKLEQEFAQKYRGDDVNPLSIVTRLHKLRRELPQLQEECRQVLAAKQEVADSAKQLALGNAELLRRLQRRAGIAPGEAGGAEVEAAFLGALAEHEAKTRVQYAGDFEDQFSREDLNNALVGSVMV